VAGRPPVPTAKKLLQGTFRADRANGSEPQPQTVLGRVPTGWSPKAKREWKLLQKWFGGAVIKDCDRAVAEIYCKLRSEEVGLEKILAKDGVVMVTDSGYLAQHPVVSQLRNTREQIIKCAMQLGLTPSARTRISVPAPTKRNAYEEFKQGATKTKR